MAELLTLGGFKLRRGGRADCAKCTGGSLATVAYTLELAYCHRCSWRANNVQLARDLGLLNPAMLQRLRREAMRRRRYQLAAAKLAERQRFLVRSLSRQLCQLWKIRRNAERRLGQLHRGGPGKFGGEQELAWSALRFVADRELGLAAAHTIAAFGKQQGKAQFLLRPAERKAMVQAALLRGFVVTDGGGFVEVLP